MKKGTHTELATLPTPKLKFQTTKISRNYKQPIFVNIQEKND